MSTQLRLVAVGFIDTMNPDNDKLVCDPSFEETWHEGVANSIDAPRVVTKAEAESCAGAYVLGEHAAANGTYRPPHWSIPEYDSWIRGYNDEWARRNGRTLAR